jgi:spoIIIJ-associated protein
VSEHTEQAKQVLGDIVKRMGIEAEILVHDEGERTRLEIQCEDPDRVVGRQGQVLDALQHLVGKIVFRGRTFGEEGAPKRPIVVDAGGYREKHADRLREIARRMAQKVIENQRPMAMDPMSPHDRRIMHMAIAEIPGVTTRSEGEGDARHMLILPAAPAE